MIKQNLEKHKMMLYDIWYDTEYSIVLCLYMRPGPL